jgi:rSAM/selenodomain-associated transferase 2
MGSVSPAAGQLSIIVPTLNEGGTLESCLRDLMPLRDRGHEVVVVDGQSVDGTADLAGRQADKVLVSEPGRAFQMNAGARAAGGEALLFLHADTRLPPAADRLVLEALERRGAQWGRFDLRLSGEHWMFPIISWAMNVRSRHTGIATGDQAIFVRRKVFDAVGGFPPQPLMEDISLSRRLKRHGWPACLRPPVLTSSRRWEREGVLRTVILMWRLRAAYALGASPQDLVRRYYQQ